MVANDSDNDNPYFAIQGEQVQEDEEPMSTARSLFGGGDGGGQATTPQE